MQQMRKRRDFRSHRVFYFQSLCVGFAFLLATGAQAAFSCGPHALTYKRDDPERENNGIRCVVFKGNRLFLYEQRLSESVITNDAKFTQSIGWTSKGAWFGSTTLEGLLGNGEAPYSNTYTINIPSWDGSPMPKNLNGWKLVEDGAHNGPLDSFKPIQFCGPGLEAYSVPAAPGTSSALACLKRSYGTPSNPFVALLIEQTAHGTKQSLIIGEDTDKEGLKVDLCAPEQDASCQKTPVSLENLNSSQPIVAGETWQQIHPVLHSNKIILESALTKLGIKVGEQGSSQEFVEKAIKCPFIGWSKLQDSYDIKLDGQALREPILPGDMIIFHDATFRSADGGLESWGPDHRVIVEWSKGSVLGILHQGLPGRPLVQRETIDLDKLVRGHLKRPLPIHFTPQVTHIGETSKCRDRA